MATPLTRAEWLDECAKLAKTYEEAMTDEAKALVERITFLSSVHAEHMHDGDRLTEFCKAGRKVVTLIETQAREIERLRETVALKDQYFKGITKLAALGEQ